MDWLEWAWLAGVEVAWLGGWSRCGRLRLKRSGLGLGVHRSGPGVGVAG